MRSTRFTTVLTVLSILFAVLLVASTLTAPLFAQSSNNEGAQISARKSPEALEAVLQSAAKTSSLVDAKITLLVPLAADALENVALFGRVQSVYITSTTSDWKGAINSTPASQIPSLAAGLCMYEQLYHEAGPGDLEQTFAMTAFTIRGTASEITQVKDSIPGASYISIVESSKLEVFRGHRTDSPKEEASTTAARQEETDSDSSRTASSFVPSSTELNIQTLPNSDRRIDVKFSWNTSDDLAGLASDRSALEIQVLFWNHAASPSRNNVSYVGAMKAWGTNTLFHPYFDTPALNGSGIGGQPTEREVTIGSFDARADFRAGQQYTIWAITEKGALDANFAKLSFQRGRFMPTLRENFAVSSYCALMYQTTGIYDPANCVAGIETVRVTPTNYTGTYFSILAPTAPPFTSPAQTCAIPAGYPFLGDGTGPGALNEQMARNYVAQILPFQKSFIKNGAKSSVGCPTNFVHKDTTWWPSGGLTQDFQGSQTGAIMLAPGASQAFWVHGGIWARYSAQSFGGPRSVVGEPTGDEQVAISSHASRGAYQAFTRGWLYYNRANNRTFYVVNAIAEKYRSVNLHTDHLGFPTSDEYPWNGGARSDFEGGHIYWTPSEGAVIVRNQQSAPPSISGYSWTGTPTANQPFGGTITGTGFVPGSTQVWFCLSGTNTCYVQPAAGVSVNSSTSLTVSNVNLGAGTWQVYVQTSEGPSERSTVFTVQSPVPAPTITGFSWNTTPTANQSFSGTLSGTGFVLSGTQVWFCINGSNICYQHPSAGVSVNSSTSLSLSNVNLGSGSWQIYVQTSAGPSARSTAFSVQTAAVAPTITGYSWNSTPRANQSFGGTMSGTGFSSGNTQVWFCVNGTNTCYQHPSAGVNVNNSTSLSLSNVNLGAGSWQIYVRTSAGQSARSSAFTVQAGPPTIFGYSWTSTPTGTQSFSGTINGSNFLSGGTQVWFCVNGTNTCYQQPAAGVSVNSLTSLSVSNVRLNTGSWQIYVQTSVGQSARSSAFTVW